MFYRVKAYLNFLVRSKNQHGVHSPFVYDLVVNCFYKKTEREVIEKLTAYKRRLLKSKETINVTDFGKGSKIFKSNEREVAKVAKHVSINKKYAKLLVRIVSYLEVGKSLEIGTSLGVGTFSLSLGREKGGVITLEGCPETQKKAKEQFLFFEQKNIKTVLGDFSETLPRVLKENTYDLIYFDGNHQKQPTLNYFKQALSSIHNDSVFIFDDIHWSLEMEEAWEEIKEHPSVKVTIDTFQWGIVFFRKEQEKEHFTIRI